MKAVQGAVNSQVVVRFNPAQPKPRKSRHIYMRAYQNAWIKRRRSEWFLINGPCKMCGTWDELQVDHINFKTKIDHRVWSWAQERRIKELSKCQVLCQRCHFRKTSKDHNWLKHGATGYTDGCRCEICKDEAVKRVNEWRWRTGKRIKRGSGNPAP